jgi:UDP-N-acetylglucosamine 4,6-dehydratase/5-epimerase
MYKNLIILITGGTGSFGNAVLRKFLKTNVKEIRILSRDEKKQEDMRISFQDSRIKFYIGDVRDLRSVDNVCQGVDLIFHAAALKQVPSCEFYPIEAVKTNILGTENILEAAIKNKVKKIVCLSTDKAVYPINAMGLSKSLMEKVAVAKSRNSKKTIINATRYGNVIGSRGSVIPLFIKQILNNNPITITNSKMTRFMMTLDEAVNLVFFAFKNGKQGEIFIPKTPATDISTIAKALKIILKKPNHPIKNIGTRHGEKIHETLLSREEKAISISRGNYYCIPKDKRDLNYEKYFKVGKQKLSNSEEYNSFNAKKLNLKQTIRLLSHIDEFKKYFN